MFAHADTPAVHQRLIEALYCDTMLLADEAREYGEHHARQDAIMLDPATSVLFSCESLRLTTRLMHLLAWLLNHRAIAAGELDAERPSARLVSVAPTEATLRPQLPERAVALIQASEGLYRRAVLLDTAMFRSDPSISPARAMQQWLAINLR